MYSLVPENMYEVEQKLNYFKEKGDKINKPYSIIASKS